MIHVIIALSQLSMLYCTVILAMSQL